MPTLYRDVTFANLTVKIKYSCVISHSVLSWHWMQIKYWTNGHIFKLQMNYDVVFDRRKTVLHLLSSFFLSFVSLTAILVHFNMSFFKIKLTSNHWLFEVEYLPKYNSDIFSVKFPNICAMDLLEVSYTHSSLVNEQFT